MSIRNAAPCMRKRINGCGAGTEIRRPEPDGDPILTKFVGMPEW